MGGYKGGEMSEENLYQRIAVLENLMAERDAEINVLRRLLEASKNALLSYQYGNGSPELAEEVVARIKKEGI